MTEIADSTARWMAEHFGIQESILIGGIVIGFCWREQFRILRKIVMRLWRGEVE